MENYIHFLETLAAKWSSESAATILDNETLKYLEPRFHRCSTPMKVRTLLSLLYLSKEMRDNNRQTLLNILSEAELDRDEWVKKIARLLSSFVMVGSVDVRETDSETAYKLVKYLNEQKHKKGYVYLSKPPLESPYISNVISEFLLSDILNNWTQENAVDLVCDMEDMPKKSGRLFYTTKPEFQKVNLFPNLDKYEVTGDLLKRTSVKQDNTNFRATVDCLILIEELLKEGDMRLQKAFDKKQQQQQNNNNNNSTTTTTN